MFADGYVASQNRATLGQAVAGPLSILAMVSRRPGSKTPPVDTLVRRSTCLNPDAIDGVQVVKIRELASKRRKRGCLSLILTTP